mmetsp:Transcript_1791/g.3105  ORF Transcript_1791/g.3105 Transcript_1791/m.3105 type:complete len:232 (+) Transcript_1791:1431-2126(+)
MSLLCFGNAFLDALLEIFLDQRSIHFVHRSSCIVQTFHKLLVFLFLLPLRSKFVLVLLCKQGLAVQRLLLLSIGPLICFIINDQVRTNWQGTCRSLIRHALRFDFCLEGTKLSLFTQLDLSLSSFELATAKLFLIALALLSLLAEALLFGSPLSLPFSFEHGLLLLFLSSLDDFLASQYGAVLGFRTDLRKLHGGGKTILRSNVVHKRLRICVACILGLCYHLCRMDQTAT